MTASTSTSILVVNADAAARSATATKLRQCGYQVGEADGSVEAWGRLMTSPPALVLVDANLSDGSGLDLLGRIRTTTSLDPVVVVMVGAPGTAPGDVAAGLDAGADGYFVRPVDDGELLARLRSHLRRRELTAELRASEERFRAFMENSPATAFIKDRQGRFLFTNSVWRRQFTPEPTEWIGRTEYDFWPRDTADIFRASDIECLERNAPIQMEETGHSTDGTERTWLVIKYPVPTPVGVAVGGMAWEITERRRVEQALKEYAALLDSAQRIGRMGSWNSDLVNGRLQWSESTCELFGIRPDQFAGTFRHFLDFVLPEDRAALEAALTRGDQNALARGGLIECEYRIRRPDGEVRWMFERGHVELDDTGQPIRRLGMVTDITERKRIEAQSLRAQRMESIGTLAGGIAHDLNNVLAPILMSIDMLRLNMPDRESAEILSSMQASAQRGADLVRQVLSFARGVEGQRVPVNLMHLISEVEHIGRDTFPKHIGFDVRLATGLWSVRGDATQLHQVLLNLLVNARDAMPRGGTIAIRAENVVLDDACTSMNPDARPGTFVVAIVTDTGTGIPLEIRDRIFEPFFTTKEFGRGTGLGLSTTLAIVRSHGGFINLHSEVGRGTRVKVYLPAESAADTGDEALARKAQLPRGRGELVLVVDDEEAIRKVVQGTLERFGYRVMLAANGAEAVSAYATRRHEIAVVFTDMAMPVMDGAALIVALRAMNPGVRIVASSGLAASGGVTGPPGTDVQSFVAKPYTADAILQTLRDVIDGTPG